ncbi:MAG: ATP-grasp domain-containing protein [Clostridia bacterium]|nr:ATP-grasp domain-containing protein [Clostridia bacterium]
MSNIIPVLLGADLNCYNVARAFHQQYGVISYAFGRYAVSATKYSKIIRFTAVPDIDSDEVMLRTLTEFAAAHEGAKLLLFGCTDDYAAMIIRHKADLPQYTCPYPDERFLSTVAYKAEFYETCEKYGIPYPKTVILKQAADESALTEDALGFAYPIVIKPSASAVYWKYPFDGMKKVYFADSPADAAAIIAQIYASGYDEKMILQQRIPGGDVYMRVLTAFSDRRGKVRAMCLGHTMLEEHTPKGLGNHAAIITEPVSTLPFADKIRNMLEDMGYTGFSNFDIKYTGEGDDFRIFEINLRQGRSNFYMTAAGMNLAKLAVELYDDEGDSVQMCENEHFWHHVPRAVAYTYTEDAALVARAKALRKAGKETSSLWYAPDVVTNPMRLICVAETLRRQFGKYKKYYPKSK